MIGTRLRKKNLGTITLAAARTDSFELKVQPNLIRKLILKLAVNFTTTGGDAIQDNPMSFLTNIQIKTPEGITLKDFSATNIFHKTTYERGTPGTLSAQSGTLAGATYDVSASILIPFEWLTAALRELTNLNSNKFTKLVLFVTATTALLGLCDTNCTFNSGSIIVVSQERVPETVADQTTQRPLNVENSDQRTVVGATSNFDFDIPSDTQIGKIFIKATDNGVRDNDLITNVKIVDGTDVYGDIPFIELRDDNKDQFVLESLIDGIAIYDFDPDGDLTDMLDCRTLNSPKLRLTVTGPTGISNVQVMYQQFVPKAA